MHVTLISRLLELRITLKSAVTYNRGFAFSARCNMKFGADEEADTVGCCSLRVEHTSLNKDTEEVTFDFLGKDSIRYFNTVKVRVKYLAVYAILRKLDQPPLSADSDRSTLPTGHAQGPRVQNAKSITEMRCRLTSRLSEI